MVGLEGNVFFSICFPVCTLVYYEISLSAGMAWISVVTIPNDVRDLLAFWLSPQLLVCPSHYICCNVYGPHMMYLIVLMTLWPFFSCHNFCPRNVTKEHIIVEFSPELVPQRVIFLRPKYQWNEIFSGYSWLSEDKTRWTWWFPDLCTLTPNFPLAHSIFANAAQ